MSLSLDKPSYRRLIEEEADFYEEIQNDPWLGKPVYSAEMGITAAKSPISASGTFGLEPYLNDAKLLIGFRTVTQQEFEERYKENNEAVMKVDEQIMDAELYPPRDRLFHIHEALDIPRQRLVSIDATFEGLQDSIKGAVLMEEGLEEKSRFKVVQASISGEGEGENILGVYENFQDDLSLNLFFSYNLPDEYNHPEVNGTIEFDGKHPEISSPIAEEDLIKEAESEILEIYEERAKNTPSPEELKWLTDQ